MKKVLASVVALYCLVTTVNSQTKPIRQSAIGISFTLTDFLTAQRIRGGSLTEVMLEKSYAKLKDMSPGIAVTYVKGLRPKIDFAGTLHGTFVDYPFPDKAPFGNNNFLLEADASAQFKLVTEDYWVIPYVSAGFGAHMYDVYYGAFIPLGVGLRVNFFDEAGLNFQSQYRVPVTHETANYHFVHSVGIFGIIGPKKEEIKAAPVVPAVAPKDTDGDGITDDNDKCPTVPGVVKYAGCPVPDTDKDGIDDDNDKCPTVPGVARYQGCPIPDTDKDGINDEEDKCPTEKGLPENFGCPKLEDFKFDARKVQFVTGSANLTKAAKAELDKGATILKEHPKVNISIEGHTDNTGTAAGNQKLSEKRAAAVKDYLAKQGISEDRMRTSGYGQNKPIADNKTAAGRALNRRVDFKIAAN